MLKTVFLFVSSNINFFYSLLALSMSVLLTVNVQDFLRLTANEQITDIEQDI